MMWYPSALPPGTGAIAGPRRRSGHRHATHGILRDIGEDLDRGRIYLPQEDPDRFGHPPRASAPTFTLPIETLMRFQAARALLSSEAASRHSASSATNARFAVHIASDVYAGTLTGI